MLELQAEIDAYWERERKEGFVRIKRAAEKLRQASSIQSTQKEESMPRLKGEEARVAFRGRVISEVICILVSHGEVLSCTALSQRRTSIRVARTNAHVRT